MAKKGRFNIKWYGAEVLIEIKAITSAEEKAVAKRVLKRARRYVPVGKRIIATPMYGEAWQSRYPGSLKRSLRIRKSKYKDGGYLVLAGSWQIYYAYWVEMGTAMMIQREGFRYLHKAVALEKMRFTRNLRKRLGV